MWVIGDIHGCIDELNGLLDCIGPDEELLFLGDYVDRGPDSRAVVERVLLEESRSTFLKGNHEDLLVRALGIGVPMDARARASFYMNGGNQTARSYGAEPGALSAGDLPASHLAFFRGLQLYYEGPDFIGVHAGLEVGVPLAEQDERVLLWIRERWIDAEGDWSGKFVVYGHTPGRFVAGPGRAGDEPIRGKNSLGIDTGCVFGGALTAYNPGTRETLCVPARQRYR